MSRDTAKRRFGPGLLGVGLCALASCASPPPVQDTFYRLSPATARQQSNSTPIHGTILVNRLGAQGLTGGRKIVFVEAAFPSRIQRYHYQYWAESPPVMIQDFLVQTLRNAGITNYVITPAERARADWIISGRVLHMTHHRDDPSPFVVVEVELGIVRADCRETVFLKSYPAKEKVPGDQMKQVIVAFERALTRLIDRFVDDARRELHRLKAENRVCR